MATPGRLDSDDLIRHAAGVRALAGHLVRGAEADDLAQDALLRGIERPPREGFSAGGWLRGLVRNISRERRRGEERRRRRERGWQPSEAGEDVARAAERTEDQLHLAQAVNRLPEMYRAVVWLRYFGDRSPKEIAVLLGEPAATVRTRLHRAMALLRDDLDAQYGGSRGRWQAAFLPLAGLSSLGKGAAVAATSARLGITATVLVLLAVAGGIWWIVEGGWEASTERDAPMRADADGPLPEGAALEGTKDTPPEEVDEAHGPRRSLHVTVVEVETGAPVPGALVWVGRELAPGLVMSADAPRKQTTDPDGQLTLDVRSPGKLVVKAYADGLLHSAEPTAVPDSVEEGSALSVRVRLSRGDVLRGQVLLPSGDKPTSSVELKIAQFRKGTSGLAHGSSVRTDETGAFVASGLRRCNLRLTVIHSEGGRRYYGRATFRSDTGHVELRLRAPNPGDKVSFRVKLRDAEGRPASAASMRLIVKKGGYHYRHNHAASVEGELAFEIDHAPGAELWLEAVGAGADGEALTRGPIPATTSEVTLTTGKPQRIRGYVRDAEGRGVGGVRLAARYLFPFEPRTHAIGDVHARTTSNANGAFTLGGLTKGTYRIELDLPPGLGHPGEPEAESGQLDVSISLSAGWRGAFRVVDGSGAGIAGATVKAYHRRAGRLPDRMHPSARAWYYYIAGGGTTDDGGQVALGGLREGAMYHLIVEAPPILRLAPIERPDWSPGPTTIRLARRGTIRGTVRYPDGTPASRGTITWRRAGVNTFHATGVQEDGRFWIRDVEEGDWTLQARSPTGKTSDALVAQIGATDVALVVPEPAKRWFLIKNWNLRDAGAPARLAAYAGSQRVGWTTVNVEGDGRVDLTRFANATHASLWIGGLEGGRFAWADRVELPESGETPVQAEAGATLSGSVTLPTGVSLDELVVEIDAPLHDPQVKLPRSDIVVRADPERGTFEVPGLPERETSIRASGFAKGVRYAGKAEVAPGDIVHIELREVRGKR